MMKGSINSLFFGCENITVTEKIKQLKQEKNAIILAHNYQSPEIQDIADYIGDSFGLAQKAKQTTADIILFCGVDFMAESAKILNPDKKVIHPDQHAICPLAAMTDVESLSWMKEKYPKSSVVSYVNTSAAVKAISDICVTSSNAVNIINKLRTQTVIFVPDTNLGLYVKRFIDDKKIILWPGICPTHHKITHSHIKELKKQHSYAEIIVHPECNPDVIDSADYVFSTQGMINHVTESSSNEFIIGTEKNIVYQIRKNNPKKTFYTLDNAVCPNMKRITLSKVYAGLQTEQPLVELPQSTMEKALAPLEKMIDFGRSDK